MNETQILVPSCINSWMQAPEPMLWLLVDDTGSLSVPCYLEFHGNRVILA
jgi:hypothetical protein